MQNYKLPYPRLLTLATALFCLLASASVTRAAIFNAADFMLPSQQSLGIVGDALLSNPTGEGADLRFKQGINNLVNLDAILGIGSADRKFRVGAQADINFFPDAEGQFGVSLVTGGLFIKRADHHAIQFNTAPVVHKSMMGFSNHPVNVYVGIPFSIELYTGHYTVGTQMAFGAQWDTNDDRNLFVSTEAGVTLSKSESYVALGIGTRFGASAPKKSSKVEEVKKAISEIKTGDKVKTIDEEPANEN